MVVYSVTVTVQPAIEPDWVSWMKQTHIPDVLRTGCFLECRIYKMREPGTDRPAYVMQYHCRSIAEYRRYCDHFAPALQKDHSDRYAGRFSASRQILEEVGS